MAPQHVLALARTGPRLSATTAGVDGEGGDRPGVPVPGQQIPDADVTIASAADENVAAGHHGPDAHGVADQRALMVAVGVEDVDLGVVERDDDVLRRQMQAGHDALIRRDVALLDAAAVPPRRLDLVALLEVRPVRHGQGLLSQRRRHRRAVEAPRPLVRRCTDGTERASERMRGASQSSLMSRRHRPQRTPLGQGFRQRSAEERRRGLGQATVRVLLAEQLPGHVVAQQVTPQPRDLRRPRQRLGIVDEGQYLATSTDRVSQPSSHPGGRQSEAEDAVPVDRARSGGS